MQEPRESRPARDAYEVLEVRPDASQTVVQAAFRALAAKAHPDAASGSNRRMAELNTAYDQVRTADRRAVYDRLRPVIADSPRPAKPVAAARATHARGRGVLDFGRYEGWSLADLARHDPDYLRWLRRHSSGIRYRNEIDELLTEPRSNVRPPQSDAKHRRR